MTHITRKWFIAFILLTTAVYFLAVVLQVSPPVVKILQRIAQAAIVVYFLLVILTLFMPTRQTFNIESWRFNRERIAQERFKIGVRKRSMNSLKGIAYNLVQIMESAFHHGNVKSESDIETLRRFIGEGTVEIDLLSGLTKPSLDKAPHISKELCLDLKHLLALHGISLDQLSAANIEIRFYTRKIGHPILVYDCFVTLTSQTGKSYRAGVSGY
jgi:hypothetical protein